MTNQTPHTKPNATYQTNDSWTKENHNRGTGLELSDEKNYLVAGRVLNKFCLHETALLILIKLQITNICLVCFGDLCLISETSA